jgi:integrase
MAVRQKYLRENPCIQVARLKTPEGACRYLLPDEETALMAELERERPFLKPLVRLAIWTGLRQCELLALTKTSVDFSRNRLYVSNPKWLNDPRRTRGVPMSTEAREILLQLINEAKGEFLFTSDRTGEPLTRGGMDSAFRRACARAGVPDLKFHSLRHTFGTRLGDKNVTLEKIAHLMGHSDITMTRRYVHPTDDALQNAVEHASIGNRAKIVPTSNVAEFDEGRWARQATR